MSITHSHSIEMKVLLKHNTKNLKQIILPSSVDGTSLGASIDYLPFHQVQHPSPLIHKIYTDQV